MWISLGFIRYKFARYRFVRYRFIFVRYIYLQSTFCLSARCLQVMSSRRLQDIQSRRFQDMFSRRLQEIFSVTICYLPRRLEDVLKVLKTSCEISWRKTKNCYAENMLKTSSRHVLKTKKSLFQKLYILYRCHYQLRPVMNLLLHSENGIIMSYDNAIFQLCISFVYL